MIFENVKITNTLSIAIDVKPLPTDNMFANIPQRILQHLFIARVSEPHFCKTVIKCPTEPLLARSASFNITVR